MSTDPTISFRANQTHVKQANSLRKFFNVDSRSDAIKRAIELCVQLMNAAQAGDKVFMKSKNGIEKQLILPGIDLKG